MADVTLEREKHQVETALGENGLKHLKVAKRGVNIVVYSEDETGGKENRCRFSYIKDGLYKLNMSNHTGKWERTPFEGTLEELLKMVIEQFPWTLSNYDTE